MKASSKLGGGVGEPPASNLLGECCALSGRRCGVCFGSVWRLLVAFVMLSSVVAHADTHVLPLDAGPSSGWTVQCSVEGPGVRFVDTGSHHRAGGAEGVIGG
jgi:hypothetical protein